MLNNGKHVLCEKPMGLTKGQVQQIFDLAKEKELFCMEVRALKCHRRFDLTGAAR